MGACHPVAPVVIVLVVSTVRVCPRATLGAAAATDVVVVVVLELATSALVTGPEPPALLAAPVPAAALCDAPEVVGVPGLAGGVPGGVASPPAAEGMNRPVRFQNPENPLKGPPTIWLDHCNV